MSHGPRLSAETERLVRLTITFAAATGMACACCGGKLPRVNQTGPGARHFCKATYSRASRAWWKPARVLLAEGGLGSVAADEIEDQAQASQLGQPERGQALFDSIYEDTGPAVVEALGKAHPEILNVTLSHAYGRILSRPA